MNPAAVACPLCGGHTTPAGELVGTFSQRRYHLRQCPACRFGFVADPWTDYDAIYTADYYAGRGADPHVDYVFEFEHPDETVRRYEWRGVAHVVNSLVPVTTSTRWLDFGCGHGGLVRHLRASGHESAVGYDTGQMAATARAAGLPILTDAALAEADGSFEVVTAIEVIEHVADPLELLRRIRRLLQPGGLLFLTTGNAAPYRERLREWRYVLSDVHVSFFEPATLSRTLEGAGFRAEQRGFLPGFTDIIRFKILKALKVRRRGAWERMLPWPIIARAVDTRLGISAHPVGWAR